MEGGVETGAHTRRALWLGISIYEKPQIETVIIWGYVFITELYSTSLTEMSRRYATLTRSITRPCQL